MSERTSLKYQCWYRLATIQSVLEQRDQLFEAMAKYSTGASKPESESFTSALPSMLPADAVPDLSDETEYQLFNRYADYLLSMYPTDGNSAGAKRPKVTDATKAKLGVWYQQATIRQVVTSAVDNSIMNGAGLPFSQWLRAILPGLLPDDSQPDLADELEYHLFVEYANWILNVELRNRRPVMIDEDDLSLTACCFSAGKIIQSTLTNLSSWQRKAIDMALMLPTNCDLPNMKSVRSERVEAVCSVAAALIARTNAGFGLCGWFHRGIRKWAHTSTSDLAKLAGLYDFNRMAPSSRFWDAWEWLAQEGYILSKRVYQSTPSLKAVSTDLLRDFGHMTAAEIGAFKAMAREYNQKSEKRQIGPIAQIDRRDEMLARKARTTEKTLFAYRKKVARSLYKQVSRFEPSIQAALIKLLSPPSLIPSSG